MALRGGGEVDQEKDDGGGQKDGKQGVAVPGGGQVAVQQGDEAVGASAAGAAQAGEGVDGAGRENIAPLVRYAGAATP